MHPSGYGKPFNFTIHLSTSDLVSQLVVDPEALKNEHYDPGVYDEDGDYVPQYSDDPRDLQHLTANDSAGNGASQTETPGSEFDPSTSDPSTSEPPSEPSSE